MRRRSDRCGRDRGHRPSTNITSRVEPRLDALGDAGEHVDGHDAIEQVGAIKVGRLLAEVVDVAEKGTESDLIFDGALQDAGVDAGARRGGHADAEQEGADALDDALVVSELAVTDEDADEERTFGDALEEGGSGVRTVLGDAGDEHRGVDGDFGGVGDLAKLQDCLGEETRGELHQGSIHGRTPGRRGSVPDALELGAVFRGEAQRGQAHEAAAPREELREGPRVAKEQRRRVCAGKQLLHAHVLHGPVSPQAPHAEPHAAHLVHRVLAGQRDVHRSELDGSRLILYLDPGSEDVRGVLLVSRELQQAVPRRGGEGVVGEVALDLDERQEEPNERARLLRRLSFEHPQDLARQPAGVGQECKQHPHLAAQYPALLHGHVHVATRHPRLPRLQKPPKHGTRTEHRLRVQVVLEDVPQERQRVFDHRVVQLRVLPFDHLERPLQTPGPHRQVLRRLALEDQTLQQQDGLVTEHLLVAQQRQRPSHDVL